MYLNSGVDYYLVNLKDITIICKSGTIIFSPNFKIKLLSYPDINKIELMESSGMKEVDINEEIVEKCLLTIIGFEEEELDLDNSPAGVVDHLATKIKLNSLMCINEVEETFQKFISTSSLFDRLALVVAHYTNNTYEYTQQLPIDELMKRYAVCYMSFPNVVPIELNEEVESKVG